MVRLLIVDDDALITESLKVILGKEKGFEVVGMASNGLEALGFIKKQTVDIVLMDIRMPILNGIDATRQIKKLKPETKVIMLTTFRDFKHIHQSLNAGASGYLLKTEDETTQIKTIKNVYEGQVIMSKEALNALVGSHQEDLLTARENDCMYLIAQGYSNKEIASQLYISEGTVRNVISIILDKLSLRDRTQIAIYYWQTKKEDRT